MIRDFMAQPITRGDLALALGVAAAGALGICFWWISTGCLGSRKRR